jgi:ABC-2 type transport system ATP-binding protein
LILLDDPFSAVDVGTEAQLIRNIQGLATNKGTPFLVTTQRYSFLEHCDRVVFMEHGEILFDGQLAKILKTIEKYRNFLVVMKKNTSPYTIYLLKINLQHTCYSVTAPLSIKLPS